MIINTDNWYTGNPSNFLTNSTLYFNILIYDGQEFFWGRVFTGFKELNGYDMEYFKDGKRVCVPNLPSLDERSSCDVVGEWKPTWKFTLTSDFSENEWNWIGNNLIKNW